MKHYAVNNRIYEIPKEAEQLSKREKEILKLITEGFENKTISKMLRISIKTVEWHKENLKQKFGLKHVSELYDLVFTEIESSTNFL